MKKSNKKAILKKRGRPATGNHPSRTFRLSDGFIAELDEWRDRQADHPSRSEAIRRLVDLGLQRAPIRKSADGQKSRAKELAGGAIDRLTDSAASDDDKASRKRRLLKGPEEFREVRIDRKSKK